MKTKFIIWFLLLSIGTVLDEDCDDMDSSINAGAEEIADNEIDENFDGLVVITLGTDFEMLNTLKVSHNPSTDILNIEIKGDNLYKSTVDVLSRTIVKKRFEKTFDIIFLTNGIYLLILEDIKGRLHTEPFYIKK